MVKIKLNKAVWIGAIIGGMLGVLCSFLFELLELETSLLGRILIIPYIPFIPLMLLIFGFEVNPQELIYFELTFILVYILVGAFIGFIVSKMRKRR